MNVRGSVAEARIERLFENIRVGEIASNVKISKKDKKNGELEGEIDLVCVIDDTAFIIEVSENKQRSNRCKKRRVLRGWKNKDLDCVFKKMGLSRSDQVRLVYVDLSERPKDLELPMYAKSVLILYKKQVEQLERDSGEDARKRFLGWDSGKERRLCA